MVADNAATLDDRFGTQYGDYARSASKTLQSTASKLDQKSVEQIGEALNNGMDRLSEFKAERMGDQPSQQELAEEALTLKETGKKSKGPRGPIGQPDIKAGVASVE